MTEVHLVLVLWPLEVGFDQATELAAWSWRDMGFAAWWKGLAWHREVDVLLDIEIVDGCIVVAVVVVGAVLSNLEADIQNCCRHMVGRGCLECRTYSRKRSRQRDPRKGLVATADDDIDN